MTKYDLIPIVAIISMILGANLFNDFWKKVIGLAGIILIIVSSSIESQHNKIKDIKQQKEKLAIEASNQQLKREIDEISIKASKLSEDNIMLREKIDQLQYGSIKNTLEINENIYHVFQSLIENINELSQNITKGMVDNNYNVSKLEEISEEVKKLYEYISNLLQNISTSEKTVVPFNAGEGTSIHISPIENEEFDQDSEQPVQGNQNLIPPQLQTPGRFGLGE